MSSAYPELTEFLKYNVLATYEFDQLSTLRQYMAKKKQQGHEAASAFCDFVELGSWFYEALTLNDVDIESLLDEVESELEKQASEDSRERAEIESDLRREQGATV
jgi:hypothetical protein